LNETVKVEISADVNSVIRNVDWITVSGFVNDTYTTSNPEVKYVEVSIRLFNKDMVDCTSYLNFDVGYSSSMVVQGPDWDYEFRFQVDLSIPYGEYFLRVDFNGSIRDYTGPVFIDLNNYMINSSSVPEVLNISAGTVIVNGYYDSISSNPGEFWPPEIVKIYGNLTWDNGTAMEGYPVNITIEALDETVLDFSVTTTDVWGGFYAEITIQEWTPEPEKIFANFYSGNDFILDLRIELPKG